MIDDDNITRRCNHCRINVSNYKNLVVWYQDDQCGGRCKHEIRCKTCTKPNDIWVEECVDYDPLTYDNKFGYSDYDVPWVRCYGPKARRGAICIVCSGDFDPQENHGSEWVGGDGTIPLEEILFCWPCYIQRRKNHQEKTAFSQERLEYYLTHTEGGFKLKNTTVL